MTPAVKESRGIPKTAPAAPTQTRSRTQATPAPPAASSTTVKNFLPLIDETTNNEGTIIKAMELMYGALQQLQKIYENVIKTKADKTTIERTQIEEIGTVIQQAYDHLIKVPPTPPLEPTENAVLQAIHKIQTSVNGLQQKYEAIETKITEAPKTYADIIKSTIRGPTQVTTNTGATNVHAEIAKRERLEKAKREQSKTEITISFRDASDTMKQKITQLTEQELAEIVKEHIRKIKECKNIQIHGVRKLTGHALKIQCYQETDAQVLHNVK